MLITVNLFATFRAGRFESAEREYPEGTTVGEVIGGLGIPERELGIVLVGGRHAELDRQLGEGETLSVFPLVGGG